MGIPSKELFSEALDLAKRLGASHLRCAFNIELYREGDAETGLRLVRDTIYSVRLQRREFYLNDVVNWLVEQSAFKHIDRKIYADYYREVESGTNPEPLDDEKIVGARYACLQRAARTTNVRLASLRFDREVEKTVGRTMSSQEMWLGGVISALYEYYYTDTATQIILNRRQLSQKIEQSIAGIEALRTLQRDRAALNRFHLLQGTDGPQIDIFDDQAERRLKILQTLKDTDLDSMYMLSRHDNTARERLFVFRVGRLNFSRWGNYRASYISSLMSLEGFRTQLDERNIERQCAKFQETERQLLGAISSTTAPADFS
jgi:hypothetical protein